MDLIRLLRSLEEFLYELIGWFVFFPRTLWRILIRPGAMAVYTRAELIKVNDQQFKDTISPVLMLILSVVFVHVVEMGLRMPPLTMTSPAAQLLFGSEQGILLTRSAIFCIYALGAALGTLRREKLPISRDSLREPFSIQAFLVCPFVVFFSIGSQVARIEMSWCSTVGSLISLASVAWYIAARTAAYRALFGGGVWRPLLSVCVWFLLTTIAILAVLTAIVL